MSVDDIAVQGAEPLFFLDYISIGKLVPEIDRRDRRRRRATVAAQAGCALLGGEMSEHPDLMEPGEFDLVGFAVGVVERARDPAARSARRATRSSASPARGCAATATRSPVRALLDRAGRRLDEPAWTGAHHTLGDELLRPSVIYAPAMRKLREQVDVHAFAHITGGGHPRQPRARAARRTATPSSHRGDVGASRGSSPRSRPPATSPTTRWSTCSTSGSACSPSSPREDRFATLDAMRAAGHEAWLVGEVVEGRGRVSITD